MSESIGYYALCFVIFLIGALLYGIGNFIFGKNRHGGKRLVIFALGIFLAGVAIIAGFLALHVWKEEGTGVGLLLVAAVGLGALGSSIWMLWRSFCQNTKKVEKTFDSIVDGF